MNGRIERFMHRLGFHQWSDWYEERSNSGRIYVVRYCRGCRITETCLYRDKGGI